MDSKSTQKTSRPNQKQRGKAKRSLNGRTQDDIAYARQLLSYEQGVPRSLGVPDSVHIRVKYAEFFTLTSTTGALATQFFRANDLYDPDYSGSGHQPKTFDQWMALYTNFRVIGSAIKVSTVNIDSTPGYVSNAAMCLTVEADSTDYSDVFEAAESSHSVFKFSSDHTNGFPKESSLTNEVKVATFFGLPQSTIMNDVSFSGSSSASPNKVVYYGVYSRAANFSSTVVTYCMAEIVYDVFFVGRKDVTSS